MFLTLVERVIDNTVTYTCWTHNDDQEKCFFLSNNSKLPFSADTPPLCIIVLLHAVSHCTENNNTVSGFKLGEKEVQRA